MFNFGSLDTNSGSNQFQDLMQAHSYRILKVSISVLAFTLVMANNQVFAGDDSTYRFTILHTNDEHGSLVPFPSIDYQPGDADPTRGGIARFATKVDSIRQVNADDNRDVLLLSGGDFMGGTPYSFLAMSAQAPELPLMQHLGYDIITIGNHEFDYGPGMLAENMQAAGYPEAHDQSMVMGSNTYPPDDHLLDEMQIPRNHIEELDNGLRIGFIGLLGDGAEQSATLTDPVEFTDPIEEAADQVEQMEEHNPDLIIAVTHSGVYEDRKLAEQVSEVDLIVGGHSHDALYEPEIVANTPIVQAGNYLHYLGQLELEYNSETGELSLLNDEYDIPFLHEIDDSIREDEQVASLVDAYTDTLNTRLAEWTGGRFEDTFETIARSDFDLSNKPARTETQAGNFITDAMRLQTEAVTGDEVDVAFQADGAIREAIRSGTMPQTEGDISFYDLVSVVGLGSGLDDRPGYPMVSAYLTGEELRRVMEISLLLSEMFGNAYFLQTSGLRMEYDHDRAILFTIPIIDTPIPSNRGVLKLERYAGEGIQDDDNFVEIERGEDERLYHIAADYYLASFLPLIGEVVPQLSLTLKDAGGNEIEVDDSIIERQTGEELKMWETVAEYAQSFSQNDETSTVPAYYETTGDRLMATTTFPLWFWPLAGFILLLVGVIYVIRRIRQRKKGSR